MWIQVGPGVLILIVPPKVGVCFSGAFLSRGNVRSKPHSPSLLLKRNIASSSTSNEIVWLWHSLQSLEFFIPILFLSMLTTQVLFRMQKIQCSTSALNTLSWTVTLFVNMSFLIPFNFCTSPLNINLLITLPKHYPKLTMIIRLQN